MILVLAPLATIQSATASAYERPLAAAERPPRVIQLSYSESDDGSSPRRSRYAFSRRTDSLRFATRHGGVRATGRSRYKPQITDTDIRGEEARHPWALVRKGGGQRVLRLVHRSLRERGRAVVRVRAKRGGLLDDVRVRVDLSDCTRDPPLYPIDCEARV